MAYTKKPRYTKKVYRKRKAMPKTPTVSSIRRTAILALETKRQNAVKSEEALSTLGGYLTNADQQKLTQDDTYSGFDGHFVSSVGTSFNYIFFNSSAVTVLVRYVVLLVKGGVSNTEWTTGANLLQDNTGNINIAAASEQQKMYSPINSDKYGIIRQGIIKLSPTGVDGNDTKMIKHWVPQKLARHRQDGSGQYPTTPFLIFLAWSSAANMDTGVGYTVEVTGRNTYYYKDN